MVGTKRYCGQLMDEGLTIDQINEKLRELDLAAWQQNALATIMEKVSASRTRLRQWYRCRDRRRRRAVLMDGPRLTV